MDHRVENQQIEQALREMPVFELPEERHREIYGVLKKQAAKGRGFNVRLATRVGVVAAAAVLAVGAGGYLYSGSLSGDARVQASGQASLPAFQVPQVEMSGSWKVEMKKAAPSDLKSKAPRYDFNLTYTGPDETAVHTVLVERGIGLWTQQGEKIPTDTLQAGNVPKGKNTGYLNMTVDEAAQDVQFDLTWTEQGQEKHETFVFKRGE